ncbi:recombinase family protein, partial [Escherichia coli]
MACCVERDVSVRGEKKVNKTYGYVRVSTDEQTSNSQRDAIIARFPTASILADDGISGTVPPRER